MSGIPYMYRKRTLVFPLELDDDEYRTVLNEKHKFSVKCNVQIYYCLV